jgi:hypothetical protein
VFIFMGQTVVVVDNLHPAYMWSTKERQVPLRDDAPEKNIIITYRHQLAGCKRRSLHSYRNVPYMNEIDCCRVGGGLSTQ